MEQERKKNPTRNLREQGGDFPQSGIGTLIALTNRLGYVELVRTD